MHFWRFSICPVASEDDCLTSPALQDAPSLHDSTKKNVKSYSTNLCSHRALKHANEIISRMRVVKVDEILGPIKLRFPIFIDKRHEDQC